MTTRADLQKRLDLLDESMPSLIAENLDEGDFWSAFAGMADVILDAASSDDFDWVNEKTDAILAKHGVVVRNPGLIPDE